MVIAGGVGAALGALGTLATIRVRVIRLEDRVTVDEKQVEKFGADIREELTSIHRRQEVALGVIADIARTVGVDRRSVDDALIRFLTEGSQRKPEGESR